MIDERGRLNQELGGYLHKTVALIDREADRVLRAGVHISLSQFLVLLSIDETSGFEASQQRIADELGINKAAVSRHIDQLVERGLLIRAVSPTSKRQNTLEMTPGGLETLRQAQQVMESTMTRHYLAAGEETARQILAALKQICASLEQAQREHV